MAVPEQTPYKEYTANGITKIFPLEFDVLEQDHLIVLVNDLEPSVGSWSLDALNDTVVFVIPPANGANIKIRRDTPMSRSTDYQTYNNSFRPEPVNQDLDNIWRKLQEMGVLNWMVDNNIKDLGDYVDSLNDETKAQFLAEIQKQGVSMQQLDAYINGLYQKLANTAVEKGWFAEFIADGDENQKIINNIAVRNFESIADLINYIPRYDGQTVYVKSYYTGLDKGGGTRVYSYDRRNENDGFLCIKGWVLLEDSPSPHYAGGYGDGVNDDTVAIQKCVNAFGYVNMKRAKWKISAKINVPSYRVIDLCGSDLVANNNTDPIFDHKQAGEGLTFLHGGGVISGTADSFLRCTGKTNKPTSISDYARQIRLDGLYIVSETIDKFLDFQNAVRQVFMHKIHAYTKNGIHFNGKCVELKGHACIIYGSTGELTAYGIKLRAPGGESYYSEGLHFTDCTIDGFGKTFDVTDIYVMSITAGHIGCYSGGKVASFGYPASTACRDIKFTGVNINGPIEFIPTGGLDYHAQFTGCVSESCTGVNINIGNNASSIKISDHKFHTSTNGIAVVCNDNNSNIHINDISCDLTFIGGVQVKGSNGINCTVSDISYAGTGDSVYVERPVLLSGIPVTSTNVINLLQKFNTDTIAGDKTLGESISSVTSFFAKGETGEIICELGYVGANAATQRLDIITPQGMEIPHNINWSSQYIYTKAEIGRISARIPYIVTSDIIGGVIEIKNTIGNTITINNHSYFGFKRDF